MTAREIWDGDAFVGFAAPFHEIQALEILLQYCTLSEQEVAALYIEISAPITHERAAHLRAYLEQAQEENRDPRIQFIQRKKIMP